MKKIFFLLVFFFFYHSTFAAMEHSVEFDEFAESTTHYIMSNEASPNKPLYIGDTKSNLIVGCKVDSHYWVYVYFNKVYLANPDINDGDMQYKVDVKTKDGLHALMVKKDLRDKNFIYFRDDKKITELMRNNDELLIRFDHYNEGKRVYKYDTKGFSALFDKHCTNVN